MNTVAFILNDLTPDIEKYPEEVVSGLNVILSMGGGGNILGQTIEVLPSFHSSEDKLFLAGGNCIVEVTAEEIRKNEKLKKNLLKLLEEAGALGSPDPMLGR